MITLTEKQQEGLDIAIQRWNDGEKYTVISGYAGTGKTTLVKFIIDAINVDPGKVGYATYTGKAAEILRKHGNKTACTLHRMIYDSRPLPGGGFVRKKKASIPYTIVVVDEISMVPKEMLDELFSFKCYVICLGDPYQLPPIEKDQDNHLLDNPHVFLNQIMRQAEESEIIQVTMKIRNGEKLTPYSGKDVLIVNKKDYCEEMLKWADEVITATNSQRNNLNNKMREMHGYGKMPEVGDKIICLKNYWDVNNPNGDALVNGTIGYIGSIAMLKRPIPKYLQLKDAENPISEVDVLVSDVITSDNEDDTFFKTDFDFEMLQTGQKCCDFRQEYKINKSKKYAGLIPKEVAYGYAITCHKAQGSQWDNVLVFEERFPFDKEEHSRWLYTACTRAINKLIIVLNN